MRSLLLFCYFLFDYLNPKAHNISTDYILAFDMAGHSPRILTFPVEIRFKIYSELTSTVPQTVHLLPCVETNFMVNFDAQTVKHQRSAAFWRFYYVETIPDKATTILNAIDSFEWTRKFPTHDPADLMGMFDCMFPALTSSDIKTSGPSSQEVTFKSIHPAEHARGECWVLAHRFPFGHLVPLHDVQSLLRTCALLRREVRQHLFEEKSIDCSGMLRHRALDSIQLSSPLFTQLRRLSITVGMPANNTGLTGNLLKLNELRSLEIHLMIHPDLLDCWPEDYGQGTVVSAQRTQQLHDTRMRITTGLTKFAVHVATKHANLGKFTVIPACNKTKGYVNTGLLQAIIDSNIAGRIAGDNNGSQR